MRQRTATVTNLRHLLTAGVALCTGCSPLAAPPPFHMMQTAEVLARNERSVTVAAGAGDLFWDGPAAGGGLRLRAGVGARQEIQLDAAALWHDAGGKPSDKSPWLGQSV